MKLCGPACGWHIFDPHHCKQQIKAKAKQANKPGAISCGISLCILAGCLVTHFTHSLLRPVKGVQGKVALSLCSVLSVAQTPRISKEGFEGRLPVLHVPGALGMRSLWEKELLTLSLLQPVLGPAFAPAMKSQTHWRKTHWSVRRAQPC